MECTKEGCALEMTEYLMRESSPLTSEEWTDLDEAVVASARRTLVGRRFIPLYGPLQPGWQAAPLDRPGPATAAGINLTGDGHQPAPQPSRSFLPVPMIYSDFFLHWRDLETTRQMKIPLDTSAAAAAATYCAQAEDRLLFNGQPEAGYEGLLTVQGRQVLPRSDWNTGGQGFQDIVRSIEKLQATGFYEPYSVVMSPHLYALLHRPYADTGILEIHQIRELARDGVYSSAVLPESSAVVVSTGPQNMDLAVAQDLVTSFLQTTNMNHYFRVFELVVLRIKQPGAICTLEAGEHGIPHNGVR